MWGFSQFKLPLYFRNMDDVYKWVLDSYKDENGHIEFNDEQYKEVLFKMISSDDAGNGKIYYKNINFYQPRHSMDQQEPC